MGRKNIVVIFCIAMALVSAYMSYAETAEKEIFLTGEKQGELYTGEITVDYTFPCSDDVKEVRLYLGEEMVSSKECMPIEDEQGAFYVTDQQILTRKILADHEPEGYEYKLAIKAAGEEGETLVDNVTFEADVSDPEIIIEGTEDNGKYERNVMLTVAVADKNKENAIFSVAILRDGEEVINREKMSASEEPFSYKAQQEGAYIVKVTANDRGQNTAEREVSFLIDQSGPQIDQIEVSGKESAEEGWYMAGEDIVLNMRVTEKLSAIREVKVYVNDELVNERSFKETDNLRTKAMESCLDEEWFLDHESMDGKYIYEVTAEDTVGNETSKTGFFYADMQVPDLIVDGIESDTAYKREPALHIVGTDNYDGATVNITTCKEGKEYDQTSKVMPADFTYSNFKEDGAYEVKIYAEDAVGNRTTAVRLTFIKDSAAPIISAGKDVMKIEGHTKDEGLWFDDSVQIKSSVSDTFSKISEYALSVNGNQVMYVQNLNDENIEIDTAGILTKEWFSSNESEDGCYEVEISAKDHAGNETTVKKTFYADIMIPKVYLSGAERESFVSKSPAITGKCSDNYMNENTITMTILLDGKEKERIISKGEEIRYDNFSEDGYYTVKLAAEDGAGNRSSEEVISFTKDGKAPYFDGTNSEITGHKKENKLWFDGGVRIRADIRDETSLLDGVCIQVNGIDIINEDNIAKNQYTLDTKDLISKEWISKNESEDGSYRILIDAWDRSGNRTVKEDVFFADVVSPEAALSGIDPGTFTKESPQVLISVKDNYQSRNLIRFIIEKDGKTIIEEIIDADSYTYSNFKADGDYVMRAFAIDPAGNESQIQTISFTKDSVAPDIKIKGAKEDSFYRESKELTIQIEERNYDFMKVKTHLVRVLDGKEEKLYFGDVKATSQKYSQSKTVKETGTYKLTVAAEDAAGNESIEKSLEFTIDNEKPDIQITRISKENGYEAIVAPKITYSDSYFESREISLSRADGTIPQLSFREYDNVKGGTRAYADFGKIESNEGLYTLRCTVRDKAGNEETETVTFAVNRFGSRYFLDEESKRLQGGYYRESPGDIIITEKNVTGLSSYEASIMKDGVKQVVGTRAAITNSGGWKIYSHVYKKDLFSEEGAYELNVTSKDLVGNYSDFSADNEKFKVFIDKTAPIISVTGIEDGGSYKGEDSRITVRVKDAIKLSKYAISCDGKILYNSEEHDKLKENTDVVLPAGVNQVVEITASDEAGNTEISRIENVTVSDNLLVRVWSNKKLVIGIIVFLVILLSSACILLKRMRKER